jgi:hypothetical protein
MQSKEASDPVLSPEIQSSLKAISFAEAGSLPIKKDGITKDNIQHLMERIKIIFVMKYLKTDYQPAEIRPNLFLGSIGAAFSKKTLDSLGITHVVCCLDKPLTPFQNVFLLNPTHEF